MSWVVCAFIFFSPRSSSYLNTIYWKIDFLSIDIQCYFCHTLIFFLIYLSSGLSLLFCSSVYSCTLLHSWNMFKYLVYLFLPYLLSFWRFFFFWIILHASLKIRLSGKIPVWYFIIVVWMYRLIQEVPFLVY